MRRSYDPAIHRRRSIRLKDYDYSQAGAYFITICTYQRQCFFGEIADGRMGLNILGGAVQESWQRLPTHYPQVQLDSFTVMPNHVHGIIVLPSVGAQHAAPLRPEVQPGSLGAIVRSFKSAATQRMNDRRGTPGAPLWQRNYYEHVIRNDAELARIREYIADNPARWPEDEDNPANLTGRIGPSRQM